MFQIRVALSGREMKQRSSDYNGIIQVSDLKSSEEYISFPVFNYTLSINPTWVNIINLRGSNFSEELRGLLPGLIYRLACTISDGTTYLFY